MILILILIILILFLIIICLSYYFIPKYEIGYTNSSKVEIKSMNIPSKNNYNYKIEGVIICVGYHDFLRWTLPFNKNHFDKLVVVTTEEDVKTQEICSYWNVHCVTTDSFYSNGDTFNKANGINYGLSFLDKDGWVIHIDADIYLPPKTRQILNTIPLDAHSIYSIDRVNCNSFTEWIMFLENPENQHDNSGLLKPSNFIKGSRLLNLDRDGYIPIGYFQLWNPKISKVYNYPNQHGSADRTDVLFSYNWTRDKRQLLPELVGIHIQTEETVGLNWNGRKSNLFGLNN